MTTRSGAQSPVAPSDTLSAVLQRYGYRGVSLASYSEDGLLVLSVLLDTVPASLLFDSGFNMNLTIHREQADQLGLRANAAGTAIGIGGAEAAESTHVQRFTIDTMSFGAQGVSIGQFPMADGALGARFLAAHNAIVDYPHDRLYLQVQPISTWPSALLKRSGDVAIRLQRVVKGTRAVYLVRGVVESHPVTLLLDTGWGTDSDGPVLDAGRTETWGLAGRETVRCTMGTLALDPLPLHSADLSAVNRKYQSQGFPHIDGVIGAAVLKTHGALIDFAHGILYLFSQSFIQRI